LVRRSKKIITLKTYNVIDIPQPENCEKCTPCLRLRMMELGLITGQKIEINDKRLGLWLINILSDNDDVATTIALRPEELDRICLKEI
jgi:Fe2+ transport system protein FeoA